MCLITLAQHTHSQALHNFPLQQRDQESVAAGGLQVLIVYGFSCFPGLWFLCHSEINLLDVLDLCLLQIPSYKSMSPNLVLFLWHSCPLSPLSGVASSWLRAEYTVQTGAAYTEV